MGANAKSFALILILIMVSAVSYEGLLVRGQTATSTNIHVTSPIQNEIYLTNAVPLNFTCYANIAGATFESVNFNLNLDGQPGYHDGHGYYLGESFPPIPSSYNTTMYLPDGNHTLWIGANFWVNNTNKQYIYCLSQIVNFAVSTGTNNTSASVLPLPSPAIPELSWLVIVPMLLSVFFIVVVLRHRAQVKKI